MSFETKAIPTEVPREKRWDIRCSRDEYGVINILQLSSDYGKLTYGLRPEGYSSWVFIPSGGGGVIILPYVISVNAELLVGLIREKRANMGEESMWCGIGGFLNPGETHREAQVREFVEETGFLEAMQSEELPGLPINADRAFYVADPQKGEGVHAYCIRILDGELEADGNCFKFKDSVLRPDFEKVNEVRFFPWKKAVQITADGLALAALAKLKVAVG
jgi:ADP-ribose pyrophosphatase YjhB (NUDIX family)